MGAQLLNFKPSNAELEAAWAAYDAARLRVEDLYSLETESTPQQRLEAVTEANRLHRIFYRLCARADAK